MAAALPAKLRDAGIAQFSRRAAQLEKFKPIITYWLRFYMTEKIIAKGLHVADQECTAYTTDLMNTLEQTKAEHPTEDALLDEEAAYAYCEQFALQTFAKGDNDIRGNKVTEGTADTLLAASTFLEMLSIWKNPPEPEIKSKLKFAKFHALRIAKAIKAGEDPNLSNPKQETPVASPTALDPNDPEVQRINDGDEPHPSTQNPYQPYVETAPNTSHPSPAFSASRGAPSPPPNLATAPSTYPQPMSPAFPPHQDVSPISQPATSRQGSIVSVGGGYFPRVDVPTFTADNAPAGLPTAGLPPAPSMDTEMTNNPYDTAPTPQTAPSDQTPQAPDPQSFYQPQPQHQTQAPPPSQPQFQQPPTPQQPHPIPPPQPQNPYQFSPPPSQPQQPQPQFTQPIQAAPPPQPQQGPLRTDEESVMEAQKHAKWAISALNFDDVGTAVRELRIALRALGAS